MPPIALQSIQMLRLLYACVMPPIAAPQPIQTLWPLYADGI